MAARRVRRYSLCIMKLLSGGGNRRDVVWLLGVTLLALLPLWLIWRKSAPAPAPVASVIGAASLGLTPVLSPIPAGTPGSFYQVPAKLSPDGIYLARNEDPPGKATGVSPTDLVIRTRNGREVFRTSGDDQTFSWFGTSLITLDRNSNVATIYAPSTAGRGPAYTQTQRNFLSLRSGPSLGSNNTLVLSPDGALFGLANCETPVVRWAVVDMATAKLVVNDAHIGNVLKDTFGDPSFALAPRSTKWPKGVVGPVAVLSQVVPTPTPPPTPFPSPTPTPILSPAQQEFLERKKIEDAQIQTLVDSVNGVDGADPKETDPARIAQITAEVKRRNGALDTQRARLFPVAPTPTPTPISLANSARTARVQCFDLGSGRLLWQTAVRCQSQAAIPMFSPDGSRLLLVGVTRLAPFGDAMSLQDSGIDVLALTTGCPLASWTFGTTDLTIGNEPPIYFFSSPPSSSLAVHDDDSESNLSPTLRFFDLSTLRETSYLPMNPKGPMDCLSPDATGRSWIALQNSETYLLSRAQLGKETSGPLPSPTPTPSAR